MILLTTSTTRKVNANTKTPTGDDFTLWRLMCVDLRKSLGGSVNLNHITFWGPYLLRLTPTKTMSLLFITIRAWRSDSQLWLCEGYLITIPYTSERYRLPYPCICDYKLPSARSTIKVVWPHRVCGRCENTMCSSATDHGGNICRANESWDWKIKKTNSCASDTLSTAMGKLHRRDVVGNSSSRTDVRVVMGRRKVWCSMSRTNSLHIVRDGLV